MAFKYKGDISKKFAGTGDAMGWVANVIDGLASIFGVNLKKTFYNDWGKQGLDLTSLADKISKVYNEVEIQDAKELDKINRSLDNLIGLAKSPVIKKAIGQLSASLNKQNKDLIERQARREVSKTRATALANDIDAAKLGDTLGSKFQNDVAEFRQNLVNTAKESGSKEALAVARTAPQAGLIERDQNGDPVEERL